MSFRKTPQRATSKQNLSHRPAWLMGAVIMMAFCSGLEAQVIYNSYPDWVSAESPLPYSTGGALIDVDQDGWLDFVVANGNDIERENMAVYYNNGDGTYRSTPNWTSSDNEYNGHLSIADVNGDGWLDVAVGLTMADVGTSTARLYLNNAGTFSNLPDWESAYELAGFHVAFGDVNGDGRPDLAVGTGWGYDPPYHNWHNYVYMNVGGMLETIPSWVSDDTWDYTEIFFCDANADGWLDLVGGGEGTYTHVYVNNAGTLDTASSWNTTDNPGQSVLFGTYGDMDDDGWIELFTADNNQLAAGSGNFQRYDGLSGGFFTTSPTWSFFVGYASAVALADIDADGDLDLTGGGWWVRPRYFLNSAGLLPATPDWTAGSGPVVESILFGDVNNDGLRQQEELFDVSLTPGRHLFQLSRQPIQWINSVSVDGVPLEPDELTFDLVHGWVSVGPEAVSTVSVDYAYSLKPEMAITNWGATYGNYLYYNINPLGGDGDFDGGGVVDYDDYLAFADCFTGPDNGPVAEGCEPGDFDFDDDIDCVDWYEFVMAWTGDGECPALDDCPVTSPRIPAPPHDTRKNRYISIEPNNTEVVAFQIELTESLYFPDSTGMVRWIGPPDGNDVSRVVAGPYYSDAWPAVLHVGDCEIGPVSTFSIRATADEVLYTNPLEIGTILAAPPWYYGDTVGVGTGALPPEPGFTPPNQILNVNDVTAYLLTADGDSSPSAHTTWVDLHGLDAGAAPNYLLNVSDLQRILFGLEGQQYVDAPDQLNPANCP
ncbi:MAG: VCBS repeat-containing protein [Phycisphaerales bacterium]|nr:MAG: VCBS repeat-containing protein [Phycisphaerales bacterium]